MVILGNDLLVQASVPTPIGFVAEDPRQLIRFAIRVNSLQQSIQFYCQHFGFVVQKLLDLPSGIPGEICQRAILAASEGANFKIELIEDTAHRPVRPGSWLPHFTLIAPSTADVVANLKAAGRADLIVEEHAAVIPVRSNSSEGGQSTQDYISIVKDLDGYIWRIMEMKRASVGVDRLCTVAIRVTNLERAIFFCVNVLGMTLNQQYSASRPPEYKTSLVGFGPEMEAVQLELRQTTTPPLIDRGNGFVRLLVGTSDLQATIEALEKSEEEFEEIETGSPEEPGGTEPAVCVSMAPDGWQICFVQEKHQVSEA